MTPRQRPRIVLVHDAIQTDMEIRRHIGYLETLELRCRRRTPTMRSQPR